MSEWISTKDRLPEIDQQVLSYCENKKPGSYPIGYKYMALDKYLACGFRTDMLYGKVLYWQPLPPPPDDLFGMKAIREGDIVTFENGQSFDLEKPTYDA